MFAGIMGVSWGLGLGTGYQNIIDQLAVQGLTKTRAFAIDLGNVNTASGIIPLFFLDRFQSIDLLRRFHHIWWYGHQKVLWLIDQESYYTILCQS